MQRLPESETKQHVTPGEELLGASKVIGAITDLAEGKIPNIL
jgi:hypothetical protein